MADLTGEADRSARRLDFERLMLKFRDSTITSDAGLLAYRELDDALPRRLFAEILSLIARLRAPPALA